jgi:hypothetical protein
MAVAAQLQVLPAAEGVDHQPAYAHAVSSTIERVVASKSWKFVRSGAPFRLIASRGTASGSADQGGDVRSAAVAPLVDDRATASSPTHPAITRPGSPGMTSQHRREFPERATSRERDPYQRSTRSNRRSNIVGVGGRNARRELTDARVQHIAAVREWRRMLGAYVGFPPPLDARADQPLPAWSSDDVRLMLALQEALNRLVETRRTYDRSRSDVARPDPRG